MKAKLFLGIATIGLLTSCGSDIVIQDLDSNLGTETPDVTFSATIENQTDTRTALSDYANGNGYHSLYWTKGDAVSIYDGTSTSLFTTDSDGSSSGTFTRKEGRIDSDASVYTAFYPSSITMDNMTLPVEQSYKEKNVANFPMYARSYTKELAFKNLCGIIRLSLKCTETDAVKVSKICLSADNAGMSGRFSVGEDGAAIVQGTDGVILTCSSPIVLYKSIETDFNIIVPKGSYNPLKVKIYDAEGKEITLVSEAPVSVARSGITRIAQTLNTTSFGSSLEMIPITESDVEFTDR